MTTFARPTSTSGPARSARRSALTVAALFAALAATLFAAAPAAAVVTEAGGTTVGLQPRNVSSVFDGTLVLNELGGGEKNSEALSFANNAGSPVLHGTNVYAIYWDPTHTYHQEWQRLINGFFQAEGAESESRHALLAVARQYRDATNQPAGAGVTFRGAYTDTNKYPTAGCTDSHGLVGGDAITCLTDEQVQAQIKTFIVQHGLIKGMNTIFYLFTPPGVSLCIDAGATHCSDYGRSSEEEAEEKFASASYRNSFCSYHSAINPNKAPTGDASTILYAAIPWSAGGLGNYHLAPANRTKGFECQDGGFDPTSKPYIEHKEKPKERTQAEEVEFAKKTPEEKQVITEQIEQERPHQQEPNQVGLGEDGAYDTGLADLIIGQVSVEQQNTVTDPLLNGWQDPSGKEATDECRNFFALPTMGGSVAALEKTFAGTLSNETYGGSNYYLNLAFNLAALRSGNPPCVPGVNLDPKFTSPNPVKTSDIVGFDGMESNVELSEGAGFVGGVPHTIYATYAWNFGDGSPSVSGYAPGAPPCEAPWLSPCAGSVFHAYQYGGEYAVTLTITDVAGFEANVTHSVTVDGPPPPSPAPTPPPTNPVSGGTPGTTTTTTTTGGSTPPPPPSNPNPVAAAAGASHSLKTVLRKGLVVRYSVNEQVAGHFDVLLAKSLAKKLRIGGAPAFGLPAGTPAQLVIAKAILVTTKGGRSTVDIQFSKQVAARLKHMHKVSLLLRLTVHNSGAHPGSTTVLSAIVLSN